MAKDILSNLTPAKGSRRKVKRIGRGQGSGHGGTATKGHKGAKSRSGHKFKIYFEGGQQEMQIVNVETLEKMVESKKLSGPITPETLFNAGAISKKNERVKILGNGELKSKLEISAHAFSNSALAKIQAAGGTATVLS